MKDHELTAPMPSEEPESTRKATRMRSDMQPYMNQRYIAPMLDDNYFNVLIRHDCILYMHGAMDAIDSIPAGSMQSTRCGRWYDITSTQRGVSLKEQQRQAAYMESLVERVLSQKEKP